MSPLKLYKLKRRPDVESVRKKRVDRFDGMSEEEIIEKYTLPDYLEDNLRIVFVGINPSLTAAYRGKYYAGPGNHFYKLLHESKLTPEFLHHEKDHKLLQYGIGLTNVVARPSRSSADIKRQEIKEGVKIVEEKLRHYSPTIAVFNGKCIYEAFADKPGKSFNFGLQPERIGNTALWVVPSSSARCSQFPRMLDKLPFYTALKKWLDCSNGETSEKIEDKDFIVEVIRRPATTSIMWRRKPKSAFLCGGTVCNRQTTCQQDQSSLDDQHISAANEDNKEEEEKKENSLKIGCSAPTNGRSPRNVNKKKSTNTRNKNKTCDLVPRWKPINKVDPEEFVTLIKQRLAEKTNKQRGIVEEKD